MGLQVCVAAVSHVLLVLIREKKKTNYINAEDWQVNEFTDNSIDEHPIAISQA